MGNRLTHGWGTRTVSTAFVLRRGAVGLTGFGVLAHVGLLATHGHDVGVAVVPAAMTLLCAGCAVNVWRTTDGRALGALIGMSLAMAVVHVVLAFGPLAGHHAVASGAGFLEHGAAVGVAGHDSAAMLAVAALDMVTGWVAALALRVAR